MTKMKTENTNKHAAIAIGGSKRKFWMTDREFTGILIGKEATNDEYVITEGTIDVEGYVPDHFHKWEDQTFHIVQGTVETKIGDETHILNAGDAVHCPRGISHFIKNIGREEVKVISYIFPGTWAEDFFEETNRQIQSGQIDHEKIEKEFGIVYL